MLRGPSASSPIFSSRPAYSAEKRLRVLPRMGKSEIQGREGLVKCMKAGALYWGFVLSGLFTKQGWRKAAETGPSGTLGDRGLMSLVALKPFAGDIRKKVPGFKSADNQSFCQPRKRCPPSTQRCSKAGYVRTSFFKRTNCNGPRNLLCRKRTPCWMCWASTIGSGAQSTRPPKALFTP